jgi:LmbE family N-acetylglucosaminyl deacetylase
MTGSLASGGYAKTITASELAPGPVLVAVPHSDDEALGLGGLLALLVRAGIEVHLVYATDGRLSPAGPDGHAARDSDKLVAVRKEEARNAMQVLGIAPDRLRFLDFPDSRLRRHEAELAARLRRLIADLRPRTVLAPFRFDQHPDHLTVRRAIGTVLGSRSEPTLREYFVYYRYPLSAEKDIRRAVSLTYLRTLDVDEVRDVKLAALRCYESQVTCYAPWQTRPILTAALLESQCRGPELFTIAPNELPVHKLFANRTMRLHLNLSIGPSLVFLKKKWLG